MKKRQRVKTEVGTIERFTLPPEAFSYPRLTLTEGRLHIEGHRGIEEYGDELITVRCKNKLISVRGRRLNLGAMDKEELLITGGIQSIEMSDRGREK